MTNEQVCAAKARLEATTPGPWAVSNWSVVSLMDNAPYYRPEICRMGGYPSDHTNDKDFIAHAPEDLRLALAEIQRLRDELERIISQAEELLAEVGYFGGKRR